MRHTRRIAFAFDPDITIEFDIAIEIIRMYYICAVN
jgi:hypothetical protein